MKTETDILEGEQLREAFRHAVSNMVYTKNNGQTGIGEPGEKVGQRIGLSHATVYNILNKPGHKLQEETARKLRRYVRIFREQRDSIDGAGQ